MNPMGLRPHPIKEVSKMATAIVSLDSDLSGIEVGEVLQKIDAFLKENRADVKRVMATFPRSRVGVIEMALDAGLDRLLEVCDYEDDCAKAREEWDDRWYAPSTAGRSVAGTPRSSQSWS